MWNNWKWLILWRSSIATRRRKEPTPLHHSSQCLPRPLPRRPAYSLCRFGRSSLTWPPPYIRPSDTCQTVKQPHTLRLSLHFPFFFFFPLNISFLMSTMETDTTDDRVKARQVLDLFALVVDNKSKLTEDGKFHFIQIYK